MSGGAEAYGTDAGGRLTSLDRPGLAATLAYDSDDHITQVVVTGGPTVDYAFVNDWTQLFIPYWYGQGVSLRAGSLIHEARHADGKGHNSGNNDSS